MQIKISHFKHFKMNKIISCALVVSIAFWGCSAQPVKPVNGPVSDLGHIDVILDSATWYAIKNDSFIQNEFGILESDTTFYGGKPSYDLAGSVPARCTLPYWPASSFQHISTFASLFYPLPYPEALH